jgi:hypothetical protein
MLLNNEVFVGLRKEFIFVENKINVVIEIADDGDVRLLHFSLLPYVPVKECNRRAYRLVGLQVAGYDHNDHHGH